MRGMKKIIVTAFEPFGGAERNASLEAVKDLTGVETVLLPVSFVRACGMIRNIAAGGPDAVICVGEAGGRSAVSLERVAVNLMDARIPDNDGFQPVDEPVCPGRPAAWFSTLPVRWMLTEVRNAELSCTAGTYVCNAVFYSLMDELNRRNLDIPAGFIHVPANSMPYAEITERLQQAVKCVRNV